MSDTLTGLVEKWRARAAVTTFSEWDRGYVNAMDKCADELAAIAAAEERGVQVPREVRALVETGMTLVPVDHPLYTAGRAWLDAFTVACYVHASAPIPVSAETMATLEEALAVAKGGSRI